MTVVSISDPMMVREVLQQSMSLPGPLYIRTGVGKKDTVIYDFDELDISIGRGIVAREGTDITLFCHGEMVAQAMQAAAAMADEGVSVRVVDIFTLKPIDVDLIKQCADDTHRFVVLEDHLMASGLAQCIANVLADQMIHSTGSGGWAFLGLAGFGRTRNCATSTATACRTRSRAARSRRPLTTTVSRWMWHRFIHRLTKGTTMNSPEIACGIACTAPVRMQPTCPTPWTTWPSWGTRTSRVPDLRGRHRCGRTQKALNDSGIRPIMAGQAPQCRLRGRGSPGEASIC